MRLLWSMAGTARAKPEQLKREPPGIAVKVRLPWQMVQHARAKPVQYAARGFFFAFSCMFTANLTNGHVKFAANMNVMMQFLTSIMSFYDRKT